MNSLGHKENLGRAAMVAKIIENSELFTDEQLSFYTDAELAETYQALLFIINFNEIQSEYEISKNRNNCSISKNNFYYNINFIIWCFSLPSCFFKYISDI